jgi:hypothetical protein
MGQEGVKIGGRDRAAENQESIKIQVRRIKKPSRLAKREATALEPPKSGATVTPCVTA